MGHMLSRFCVVSNTAFQYLRCMLKISPWSLVDLERICILKIPVWFFFHFMVSISLPWLDVNTRRDPICAVMKACQQHAPTPPYSISAVEESPLLWTYFCSLVRHDHSLGSSTLTDSSRIWPYDKPGQLQEDAGFQPFLCSSHFQPCTHVINTQGAISLKSSLHHSCPSASVPSFVLQLDCVSVVKVAFSAQTSVLLDRGTGSP